MASLSPPQRRHSSRQRFVADLSQCLFDFVIQLLPPPDELHIKEDVRKLLERLIRTIEPDSRLLAFGSTANGFSLRNSDMDLCCLIDSGERLNASDLVTMLGDLLERETKFHVKTLPHARIPIVKLSLDPSPGLPFGIACDIGFENRLAIENTRLLYSYAKIDPTRIRTLVLFLKIWSKRRKINSPYKGTLSSYGYVLLVIYFLVHVKNPPILPNLQQMPPLRPINKEESTLNGYDVWFFDDIDLLCQRWQSENTETVAELLIDFFRYFSRDFSYNTGVASIRAGLLKKEAKGWQNDLSGGRYNDARERNRLCVEDPFEVDYNVARCVTKDGLYTIRGEFMRATRILSTRPERAVIALAELCEERKEEDLVSAPPHHHNHHPNHHYHYGVGFQHQHQHQHPPQTPYTPGNGTFRPRGATVPFGGQNGGELLSPTSKFYERAAASQVIVTSPQEGGEVGESVGRDASRGESRTSSPPPPPPQIPSSSEGEPQSQSQPIASTSTSTNDTATTTTTTTSTTSTSSSLPPGPTAAAATATATTATAPPLPSPQQQLLFQPHEEDTNHHMAPQRAKWTSPPPPEASSVDHTLYQAQLEKSLELATAVGGEAREGLLPIPNKRFRRGGGGFVGYGDEEREHGDEEQHQGLERDRGEEELFTDGERSEVTESEIGSVKSYSESGIGAGAGSTATTAAAAMGTGYTSGVPGFGNTMGVPIRGPSWHTAQNHHYHQNLPTSFTSNANTNNSLKPPLQQPVNGGGGGGGGNSPRGRFAAIPPRQQSSDQLQQLQQQSPVGTPSPPSVYRTPPTSVSNSCSATSSPRSDYAPRSHSHPRPPPPRYSHHHQYHYNNSNHQHYQQPQQHHSQYNSHHYNQQQHNQRGGGGGGGGQQQQNWFVGSQPANLGHHLQHQHHSTSLSPATMTASPELSSPSLAVPESSTVFYQTAVPRSPRVAQSGSGSASVSDHGGAASSNANASGGGGSGGGGAPSTGSGSGYHSPQRQPSLSSPLSAYQNYLGGGAGGAGQQHSPQLQQQQFQQLQQLQQLQLLQIQQLQLQQQFGQIQRERSHSGHGHKRETTGGGGVPRDILPPNLPAMSLRTGGGVGFHFGSAGISAGVLEALSGRGGFGNDGGVFGGFGAGAGGSDASTTTPTPASMMMRNAQSARTQEGGGHEDRSDDGDADADAGGGGEGVVRRPEVRAYDMRHAHSLSNGTVVGDAPRTGVARFVVRVHDEDLGKQLRSKSRSPMAKAETVLQREQGQRQNTEIEKDLPAPSPLPISSQTAGTKKQNGHFSPPRISPSTTITANMTTDTESTPTPILIVPPHPPSTTDLTTSDIHNEPTPSHTIVASASPTSALGGYSTSASASTAPSPSITSKTGPLTSLSTVSSTPTSASAPSSKPVSRTPSIKSPSPAPALPGPAPVGGGEGANKDKRKSKGRGKGKSKGRSDVKGKEKEKEKEKKDGKELKGKETKGRETKSLPGTFAPLKITKEEEERFHATAAAATIPARVVMNVGNTRRCGNGLSAEASS